MTKPDFSKIFAQNGAVTALNDSQFLQGFEYLGANPPTKEEFNWLFQQLSIKLQYLNENSGLNLWQPEHTYDVGNICYSKNAASYKYMECTQAGTTAAGEPTWPDVGSTVTDGTCKWRVYDLRQGTSIGRVPALVDVGGGKAGLPAVSGKLLKDIGSGSLARNVPLFGPLSAEKTAAYLEGIGSSKITLKADTLLAFAAGMGDMGPLEHIERVPADISLTLTAAGLDTVPLAYTDGLCNGGTAISSGNYSGSSASNAFDKSANTHWSSSAVSPAADWLGYDFGEGNAKRIRKIMVSQASIQGFKYLRSQYSDDNITWNTVTLLTGTFGIMEFTIPDVGRHRYWRIYNDGGRVDGATGGGIVNAIYEIEMYEALQTHYLYADRNKTTGAITLGSTKQKPRIADTSDIYTDNLCVGGAAISGGDYANRQKEQAYDGINIYNGIDAIWGSSQVDSAITGNAWIGYDFGVARQIRLIKLWQFVGSGAISSIKVQKSADGTTWNDVQTFTGLGATALDTLILPTSSAARYWRLLAQSTRIDGLAGPWNVFEINMHEIASELLWYEPTEGRSHWYDGNSWADVERVPLGSANVDSAGKIVSISMNPYGLSRLRALPAENTDDVVTLGQFLANLNLSSSGYLKIPINGSEYPLLVQWGNVTVPIGSTTLVAFPITYPNRCLLLSIGNVFLSNSAANTAVNIGAQDVYGIQKTGFKACITCVNSSGAATSPYIAIGF